MSAGLLKLLKGAKCAWHVRCHGRRFDQATKKLLVACEARYGECRLTPAERREKNAFWARYVRHPVSDDYFRIAKKMRTFDPRYIPESVYWERVVEPLRHFHYTKVLEDKSLYSRIFRDVRRPFEPVKRIEGVFYSDEDRPLSRAEALGRLADLGGIVFFKAASGSNGGRSILPVRASDPTAVEAAFGRYAGNFVCQVAIRQHPGMAALNPTSVNTYRVTSLFINAEFSAPIVVVRMGGEGAVVDNYHSGGAVAAVGAGGVLSGPALMSECRLHEMLPDGSAVRGHVVPSYDRVLEAARRLHESLPYVPWIAWDFAIDESGAPVLIEANMNFPDVLLTQLSVGPAFGARTEEMMEYMSSRYRTSR